MVRITRFLVREELSALGPDVTIAEDQYAIQKWLKATRFQKKGWFRRITPSGFPI